MQRWRFIVVRNAKVKQMVGAYYKCAWDEVVAPRYGAGVDEQVRSIRSSSPRFSAWSISRVADHELNNCFAAFQKSNR
jgi:hypothetical protein